MGLNLPSYHAPLGSQDIGVLIQSQKSLSHEHSTLEILTKSGSDSDCEEYTFLTLIYERKGSNESETILNLNNPWLFYQKEPTCENNSLLVRSCYKNLPIKWEADTIRPLLKKVIVRLLDHPEDAHF